MSLDVEITAYKKLLDSEENRYRDILQGFHAGLEKYEIKKKKKVLILVSVYDTKL